MVAECRHITSRGTKAASPLPIRTTGVYPPTPLPLVRPPWYPSLVIS